MLRRATLVAPLLAIALLAPFFIFRVSRATRLVPDYGGVYVEAVAGQPMAINPLLADFNDADKDLVRLVFSGLTRLGADGRVLPDLAEYWEVYPEEQAIVFYLRKDVRWHDGPPFTAADVVFTISIIQSDDFPGTPELKELWEGVTVQAEDDHTVRMQLPEFYSPFVTYTGIGMLPRHILGGTSAAELVSSPFNTSPVGTGPFRVESVSPQEVRLVANEDYYDARPYLDEIRFRYFSNYQKALAALDRREVRGILLPSGIHPEEVKALEGLGTVSLYRVHGTGYTMLYLNARSPFFRDKRVRRALAYALDRRRIVEHATKGQGLVANSPIVAGTWANETGEQRLEYDPERARRLLDEAGWLMGPDGVRERDGLELSFWVVTNDDPARVSAGEEVVRQLAKVGVKVTLAAGGAAGVVQDFLVPREYDAAIYGWDPGYDPDPYAAWHSSQTGENGFNLAGYTNPDFDRLLEDARAAFSWDQRRELYGELQRLFAEELPSIPLYYRVDTYALDSRIMGVELGVLFEPSSRFVGVTDWYMKTRKER